MPRFNAEQIPNALKEQMWREQLGQMMFDKRPVVGWDENVEEFNSDYPSDYVPPGPNEFVGQDMGPYQMLRPQQRMNDTKTQQQVDKENRARAEAYAYSRTPMYSPLHQNNPERPSDNEIGDLPPNTGPMNRLYERMPPDIPRYPGMAMPAPDESQQMQQLMQFYTNEDI